MIMLNDRLMVLPDKPKEMTAGGIAIPDQAKEKPVSGVVLLSGDGLLNGDVGCRVYWPEYAGIDFIYKDQAVKILSIKDLLMYEHIDQVDVA